MINKNLYSNSTFADFRELLSRNTPFIYIHFKKNFTNNSIISKYNQQFKGGIFEYNTNETIGDVKKKIFDFSTLEVDFYYQTETEGKTVYNKLKKEFDSKSLDEVNQYASSCKAKNIQEWLAGFISGVETNLIQEQFPIEKNTNINNDLQEKIDQLYDTTSDNPLYVANKKELILLFEKHSELLKDENNLKKYIRTLFYNKNTEEKSLELINHWWPLISNKRLLLQTALSIYNQFQKHQEIISIYRSDPSCIIINDITFNYIIWALYKNNGTETEALDLIRENLPILNDTFFANYSIGCILRYHAKKTKDSKMLEEAIHYFTLDKNVLELDKTKAILEEWKIEDEKQKTNFIDDDAITNLYKKLQTNILDQYWGDSSGIYNLELIEYCEANPLLLKDTDVMVKYLWSMYDYAINRDEKMLENCYLKTLDFFQRKPPSTKEAKFIYACILRSIGWRKKDKKSLEKSISFFEEINAYVFKTETEDLLKDMNVMGIKWQLQLFSESMDFYHEIITKSKKAAYETYRQNKKRDKLENAGIKEELIDKWLNNKKINLWIVHCSIEASETSIGKLIIPTEGKLLRDGAKDFIKSYWSVLENYWIKETNLNKGGGVSKVNIIEINECTY
jgi:hypothetical protein